MWCALLACAPFAAYVLIPTDSNPYAFGARLVWGGGLLVIPSALLGAVLGAVCSLVGGLARKRLHWRGPVSIALALGLTAGILGAVPLGMLAGSTELQIDVPTAIWVIGLYLVLAFGGYGLWWALREARRNS